MAISKETEIPLVLTNKKVLLNISKDACKHRNNLFINKSFKDVFQNELVTLVKQNKKIEETNR